MKFTLYLVTLVLATVNANTPALRFLADSCHSCDCLSCGSVTVLADGRRQVTVKHCKTGTFSWMCCTGSTTSNGSSGVCLLSYTPGACIPDGSKPKCGTVGAGGANFIIPADATSFTINTHDGRTEGDAALNPVCAGNGNNDQGGSCTGGTSNHCLVTIELSTCPTTTPSPVTPSPVTPSPVTPSPVTPSPVTPSPVTPSPVTPSPVTPSPVTPSPSRPPTSMNGDPHIKNWIGEWFMYMGECDLKLLHVPNFEGHGDLDIHVRTTIRSTYSYIETAVVRIGSDTLEVSSWGEYNVNGVEDANVASYNNQVLRKGMAQAVPSLGGYPVYHTEVSKKHHVFDIILGKGQNITLSNLKDIVSVTVNHGTEDSFARAVGLLGNFEGRMLARDGVTDLHEDMNAMGQEWQIRDTEPMLFQSYRAPQYPEMCRLPNLAEKEARRLGEGITEDVAMVACAHLKHNTNAFAACVYDVTATNDLDQAQSGAF